MATVIDMFTYFDPPQPPTPPEPPLAQVIHISDWQVA